MTEVLALERPFLGANDTILLFLFLFLYLFLFVLVDSCSEMKFTHQNNLGLSCHAHNV